MSKLIRKKTNLLKDPEKSDPSVWVSLVIIIVFIIAIFCLLTIFLVLFKLSLGAFIILDLGTPPQYLAPIPGLLKVSLILVFSESLYL